MTTDKYIEALKLALEALEDYVEEYGPHEQDSGAAYAITAIREALAHTPEVREQPAQQQEPVAWKDLFWKLALILKCLPSTFPEANGHVLSKAQRLMDAEFTSPPTVQPRQRSKPLSNLTEDNIPAFPWVSQKPWQGLTDEEKERIRNTWGLWTYKAIEDTEAKLKEKNGF